MSITIILLLLSLLCFVLAAVRVPTTKVDFTALGLAIFIITLLIAHSSMMVK